MPVEAVMLGGDDGVGFDRWELRAASCAGLGGDALHKSCRLQGLERARFGAERSDDEELRSCDGTEDGCCPWRFGVYGRTRESATGCEHLVC